jgi:7-cyano-7-deazaguanine synthase
LKAVCLLSGGLDSATCLAYARREGFDCYALSFDYGQRHRVELDAARRVAAALGAADHRVAKIDLRIFGHSALTDDIDVPKGRDEASMGTGIPITYVPARNTIFLSFALAWAEVLEANDIYIGVNALDYSGYPDCRPEFIHAFEHMSNLATRTGVEGTTKITIRTPLIALSKADIVRLGVELGVPFGLTHSCYDPDAVGRPCGECDSCLLRAKGFRELRFFIPCRARAGWLAFLQSLCGPADVICGVRGAIRLILRGRRKGVRCQLRRFWKNALNTEPRVMWC